MGRMVHPSINIIAKIMVPEVSGTPQGEMTKDTQSSKYFAVADPRFLSQTAPNTDKEEYNSLFRTIFPKALNLLLIITVRQRSCGKVMFSQMSVILFRGCGRYITCIMG